MPAFSYKISIKAIRSRGFSQGVDFGQYYQFLLSENALEENSNPLEVEEAHSS
jgi:hypothetical protein